MIGRLWTLALLEMRQVGGMKLAAIACMLAGLAFLPFGVRIAAPTPSGVPAEVFWPFVFVMMLNFVFLQTMVILIPLLFATSLIRNEVEEGTIVYLVTRPIPRPLLLLAKYAAVTALSMGLVVAGMVVFEVAFLVPGGDPTGGRTTPRAMKSPRRRGWPAIGNCRSTVPGAMPS